MNRKCLNLAALAILTLTVVTATPTEAADAGEILEAAMTRYEERVAAIESVTIVHEVMGMASTTRLEKTMIEDRPVLMARGAGRGGDIGSTYRHLDHMARNATVTGSEEVDGHSCWVIAVSDLEGMHVGAEGADDFQSSDGTLYIDKEDLVVRRMRMNGVTKRQGKKQPVTLDMHLQDYREVDGWLHPFLTEVKLGGEGGGEAPEVAEMRKAMAKMKEELARMPAEQREMMERMMKDRMPQLDEAMEDGEFSVKVAVREIRVNEPR